MPTLRVNRSRKGNCFTDELFCPFYGYPFIGFTSTGYNNPASYYRLNKIKIILPMINARAGDYYTLNSSYIF